MLTSSYLASCPDEIAKIYSRLESDILKLMAERIAKNIKGAKNISEWQMLVLVESGALREDIQRLTAKYDEAVRVEIMRLFDDAVRLSTENDIKYAGRNMSPGQRQQLESLAARLYHPEETNKDYYAMVKRYADDYAFNSIRRLTATIAATTERQFIAAANAAFMQVASGASDYDSAMRRACHELAGQGVYTVSYTESGRQVTHTIETAIRANIITGINQSAAQQTEINCQYLGCDLVETSAHIGARNKDGPNEWSNHEEWQGSVFHLGSGREYVDGNGRRQFAPSFKASCGLGYADGICGINCRHSYYPYFEGTKQTFGMIDDEPIDIDGKKISRYDAEQKLRYYERGVRRWKREADMLASIGEDNTRARMKIAEWQGKAKAWTEKTGLRRDYAREFVGTASGKQVYGLGRDTKKSDDSFIKAIGNANNNDSKITYMDKKTAEECKNFLQENFGIKTNYDKVDVGLANGINKTVVEVTDEFGKGFLSDLKEIRFVTQEELSDNTTVAAYNAKEKVIKIPANSSMEAMSKQAKIQYNKYNNWSTDSEYHFARHEIGHAIGNYLRKNNPDVYKQLKEIFTSTISADGFDKNNAYKLLSNYGFLSCSEMIADSVAEYMNGNARYFALRVIKTVKRGL